MSKVKIDINRSRSERLRITSLLQSAADLLLAESPDTLEVWIDTYLDEEFIRFSLRTWSPALQRATFTSALPLFFAEDLLDAKDDPSSWERCASTVVAGVFYREIKEIEKRHERARALGLVANKRLHHLEPARLVIDRTLLAVLDDAGIDARCAAMEIGSVEPANASWILFDLIDIRSGGRIYKIGMADSGPPVLSTWVEFGDGYFNGHVLELPFPLSSNVMSAAPGLLLGELISTGHSDLDGRLITEITSPIFHHDPRWKPYQGICITLAIDPVELGSSIGDPIVRRRRPIR